MSHVRSKVLAFVFDNSLLLLAGTAAAVVWANLDLDSYDAVAHSLHFWVNEIGMVFFFALAAKEVFEATLPGGSLASPRRALTPLAAAVGGMVAPALDLREDGRLDTLNRFEHWWAKPVQFVLLFFGLANAGVPFQQIGPGTYYVLAGLIFGKPVGILLFSKAARLAGASFPPGVGTRQLLVVGVVASIGFTVSLFFATAAFPNGPALAETKMGALLSFAAAPLAIVVAKALRLQARTARSAVETSAGDEEQPGALPEHEHGS